MAAGAAVKKAVETGSRKVSHGVKQVVGRRADDPAFVTREICIGLGLGLMVGAVWKMWHVNYRRQVNEFYDALDKGEITVVIT
ncbi:cytochrome c oxidase subunit 5C-like [Selaginella moellendorffii]|uniref:cytochrome c oxidase subunit 5C-like n=1 Tax=Selaginella moellendorffii TaxID=88036 RepID=UPI000D1D0104|nr:cytochrome c oxidase subunit 5C-like [Selaginella moellendorffii]|eukprot:XP_024544411.1 cytochrome c oxidase subunit 5C-like [Selaginella moellendorffii]